MESHRVDNVLVVIEAFDHRLLSYVPQFYSTVIRTRNDKPSIRRELARSDPVCMGSDRELKLSIIYLENLKGLVVRSG